MTKSKVFRNEGDVKKEVKRLLNQHKWFWWMPPANGFGKSNVDFNALRGKEEGTFLAIETKFGNNRPTVMQKAFMSSVLAEGGIALVVNDKTIPLLAVWLQAFDAVLTIVGNDKSEETERHSTVLLNATQMLTEMIGIAA